ncbi:SCO0607 family lipoprotein [Streptomyces sp. NPDC048416]|uniref:SCO0607 family lipoprotein n=1 Tax=Streptomyces sp. NPDC048416 TaxID=3365546 RepID=UPI00370FEDA0
MVDTSRPTTHLEFTVRQLLSSLLAREARFGGVRRRQVPVWLTASAAVALAVPGCSSQDAICGGGEYPVVTVGSTGRACVDADQGPPKGYVRYPKGKVPQHVDDTWDRYWRSHTVDGNGKITGVPR